MDPINIVHPPLRKEEGAGNKVARPAVSFVGVGWIGKNRMNAIRKEDIVTLGSVADTSQDVLTQIQEAHPDVKICESIEEIMDDQPDGVVIATPSALHASQAVYALENGASVFCQKPLGRTAQETRSVVEAARRNNKLIGVDFSYRLTEGMQKIYHLVKGGALGNVYAAHLVFHNAYGPDKDWFYNPATSGGGCVIDLGSHLIDLALWILGFPKISKVSSSLFSGGKPLISPEMETEDFALAFLETESGAVVDLSCSWNLQAGHDAIIEATFYGTEGGACFRNVNGSFFEFEAYRFYAKTKRELLASPPEDWGGRAAIDWARRLSLGEGFHEDAFQFVQVAEVIDRIYKRQSGSL